jgi:hypothetical protein
VTVVDPSAPVARQVNRTLELHGMSAPFSGEPTLTLASTGDPDDLASHLDRVPDLPEGVVVRRW